MDLRAALEQLDEALDRLEDAVASLPPVTAENLVPAAPSKTEQERKEIARRLDRVIEDMQGFLDFGPDIDKAA